MTTRHAARPEPRQGVRPPAGRTVSSTSADRFAARVRHRRRRRWLAVVAVLVLLAGGGWLAWRSPWATVHTVELHRVPARAIPGLPATRVPDAQLTAQAEEEIGHPMLAARVADVTARLRRLPLVRSAQVRRAWPSTLVITVAERQPVAVVPAGSGSGAALDLVDSDGVILGSVSGPAPGLPRLDVDLQQAGTTSLRACLSMLRQLPVGVTRRIATVGADSPDGIRLVLDDGSTVSWGDASRTPRKAEVLVALLRQKAAGYDVSSPDTPTIRPR